MFTKQSLLALSYRALLSAYLGILKETGRFLSWLMDFGSVINLWCLDNKKTLQVSILENLRATIFSC